MLDLTGKSYNYWTIVSYTDKRTISRGKIVICRCKCGLEKEKDLSSVINGYSKQCRSCASKNQNGFTALKHGDTVRTSKYRKLYSCWKNMRSRCYGKYNTHYKSYGGRGIAVCEYWKLDYLNFKDWALKNGWEENLTIDRIDNDGDYTPYNCRWISLSENSRLMNEYHCLKRTGGHSEESYNKTREKNIKNSGIKVRLLKDDLLLYFDSIGKLADYLADVLNRKRENVYSQAKQCLHENNSCVSVGGYKIEKA